MTVLKKFIDNEDVKLYAYSGLWFWGVRFPGAYVLWGDEAEGAVIIEVHALGFALELVFE